LTVESVEGGVARRGRGFYVHASGCRPHPRILEGDFLLYRGYFFTFGEIFKIRGLHPSPWDV